MRETAEKRHNDWKKAIRKREIVHNVYPKDRDNKPTEFYDNLHQYSKNKIHCSCPMCSQKTNNKNRSGARGYEPSTNWSIADTRRIEEMEDQILDNE